MSMRINPPLGILPLKKKNKKKNNQLISSVYCVPCFEFITLNTSPQFNPYNTTLRLVLLVFLFEHEFKTGEIKLLI